MSTTKTMQISQSNSGVLAAELNAAIAGGRVVTLNGHTPVAPDTGDAVRSWSTGSISFKVAAKKPGATRDVYVKIGHMLDITSEAPADQPPAPHATVKPRKTKAPTNPRDVVEKITLNRLGKAPIAATVKGETGYLTVRTVNGKYRYAVTMDEKNATMFSPGGSLERHAKRAEAAGIKIAA
uniref:Uncharacterized protein n=2 Tax=unclassified bacterial viruses TaxID=12333 RepID=A0AAU7J857_9VIRU